LSNKTASLLPETCTDTAVIVRLRELGTAEIGKLTAVMGVVTRTSEVRPELLQGTFKCLECGNVVKNVEQQFKYTEVLSLHIIHFYFSPV
jgi:DNA replicative helicase MCM subunit Mcm2 (Cdc46/Mcm family)